MHHEILVGISRAVAIVFTVCWVVALIAACREPVKTRRNELFGAMLLLIKYTVYTWIPPANWSYWHYRPLFGAVFVGV
jgi:membrane-associated HD superfamily phosphohydrolase